MHLARQPRGGTSQLWAMVILLAATSLLAQEAVPPNKTPQISPTDLVRQTVANEVSADNNGTLKHMFRSHKNTPKGTQTHLYVETKDAMAGMLLAVNGKPLTEQEQQAEIGHLDWLMNNPDQLRKKQAREKEDEERSMRIIRALPDAFHYELAGTETGTATLGKPGDPLVRLKFTPDPAYNPPSHVEEVLRGMQGYLLIDSSTKRLARIDGTLFRDVTFGWGILGHLDKGGHFMVQQADVGDGAWEITHMALDIKGKILLFKGISIVSDEVLSDFRQVPRDISFSGGVELLKNECQKTARATTPSNATAQSTQ